MNTIIKIVCVAALLGNCAVFVMLYPQYTAGKLYVTPGSIEGESQGLKAPTKLFLVSELPANLFRRPDVTESTVDSEGNLELSDFGEMPGPFIREEPLGDGGSKE